MSRIKLQIYISCFRLKCVVTGLSPQRPGLLLRTIHVAFVVDRQHWDRVFLPLRSFSPVIVVSVGKAVLLGITAVLALWFIFSSIRYSNYLIYVLWPTPAWKMKYCVTGTQSVPDSRVKLKLPPTQLDPISLTGLDQKLKGAVTFVGYVYTCSSFCSMFYAQRYLIR